MSWLFPGAAAQELRKALAQGADQGLRVPVPLDLSRAARTGGGGGVGVEDLTALLLQLPTGPIHQSRPALEQGPILVLVPKHAPGVPLRDG